MLRNEPANAKSQVPDATTGPHCLTCRPIHNACGSTGEARESCFWTACMQEAERCQTYGYEAVLPKSKTLWFLFTLLFDFLKSSHDLEHMRSIAQQRDEWTKLAARIREAAEASQSEH
ncbi:hypothetical protein ElyMa_006491700 [Elysia marginata]|uniref:Uncharacterized protein n=1 Tax=Elysia marginata TaxID=1093978 RepID=A0AAV4I1X3_9GAST|nr:hypothetical protein ElyMa_006491700 [Elysia marginata]